ncbi:hypothetical protein SOVF_019460 [Spinacia oleracea]|nr:hypothetical protein SOVF_019460 [Spinacia oleracea]
MEASFVRNLMEGATTANDTATTTTTAAATNSRQSHLLHPVHPRLDRFIPDISESTLDSSNRSAHSSVRVSRTCNRQKGRAIIRPYKMSHDQVVPQVVPQLEDISGDKGV